MFQFRLRFLMNGLLTSDHGLPVSSCFDMVMVRSLVLWDLG
jgi:hypothetical protein